MIKQWFQSFSQWSEPFPSVRDGAQRSRAQTLAAICLLSLGILMPLTFIGTVVNHTLTISTLILRGVIVVVLILVYLLARRGKNELGARVIVLLLWGLLFGVSLSGNATIPGALRTLDLLILVPLLTSVIIPQRETVVIWLLQQGLLLGVPLIRPTLDTVTALVGPFLFNFVIGGSILTVIALYQGNERKLREQIERKTREQDALMNNLPDFILRIDPNFRYLYVNALVQAAFASPLDDIIGRHVLEIPPDPPPSLRVSRLAWMENAQAAIDSKQTIHTTLSQSPLEDIPFWFDLTFVPEMNASGRVESVLVVERDITERKRLTDEIERKGRELESLMTNLPDYVIRVDIQFRYLYANPVALGNIDWTLDDLLGKKITDLPVRSAQHTANRAEWLRLAQAAIDTKQRQQFSWAWEAGYPYWFDLMFVPEMDEDGAVQSLLIVGRDVTEQKIVEEALERERTFIRKIMDTAPLMIYVYDRRIEDAARMAFANPALERFYGVPSGDWSGLNTPQFLDVVHPDDLPRWVSYLASVIAVDSDPVQTLELRLRRADGEYRWLRHWLTVFDDQPSRQHGQILGIVADITDEKALQAAMLESEQQRATLEATQSLNILKTQMMIRVADQFRNPLAAVLTATDMLDSYSARMTEEARQMRFVQIRD
ncbi:MAG: PAS domain-containing protein [Chloroflexota bacterium]|nr:PAS domain-containing protein [Chloroflexota bacterium]